MDNAILILKNQGYNFTAEDQFLACPLCKSAAETDFTGLTFYCINCMPLRISVKDLFILLKIKVDTSPTDVKELLENNIDVIFDPSLKGIKTGYEKLDSRTNGILPDHLYILGSETGMGKSVFSTNLLINISKEKTHTSYFDLENGKILMLKRFIVIASNKPVTLFNDADNIGDIIEAGESLSGMITFRDQQMLDPYIGNIEGVPMAKAICELIRSDVKEKETRVIVIDPLENFETEDKNYAVTGRVVELFKNLAQELHVAIIINHHLKKPSNSYSSRVSNITETVTTSYRIPTIYDFIGTSKITNKATDVWTIVRQKEDPDIKKRGRTLLRILKSREDCATETSDLYFNFNLNTLKISEIDLAYNQYDNYPKPEVKL